jgi:AcrR family transcriptional regulator
MRANNPTDSTRDRILHAATEEFAARGIAGARIDRIAKSARTSKERVYAHFRSKEQLYRFVAAAELAAVTESTQLDPENLPEYAGRVHDYFVANPHNLRLMRWGDLEFDGVDDASQEVARQKVSKLKEAQQNGSLDPHWNPLDILVFVNQLASAWADQPGLPPAGSDQRARFLAARRAAIVTAVNRLFPAAAPAHG